MEGPSFSLGLNSPTSQVSQIAMESVAMADEIPMSPSKSPQVKSGKIIEKEAKGNTSHFPRSSISKGQKYGTENEKSVSKKTKCKNGGINVLKETKDGGKKSKGNEYGVRQDDVREGSRKWKNIDFKSGEGCSTMKKSSKLLPRQVQPSWSYKSPHKERMVNIKCPPIASQKAIDALVLSHEKMKK